MIPKRFYAYAALLVLFVSGCNREEFSEVINLEVEGTDPNDARITIRNIPKGLTFSPWGNRGIEIFGESKEIILRAEIDGENKLLIEHFRLISGRELHVVLKNKAIKTSAKR